MAQSMLAGEEPRLYNCPQIHTRYAFLFNFLTFAGGTR
jgi:hypothetical protein